MIRVVLVLDRATITSIFVKNWLMIVRMLHLPRGLMCPDDTHCFVLVIISSTEHYSSTWYIYNRYSIVVMFYWTSSTTYYKILH